MRRSLRELRRYRELGRRRDSLIRQAAKDGSSTAQIARAVGLSLRHVKRILAAG